MKKRSWVLAILSLVMAGCFACGLTACNGEDEEGISYKNITFTSQTVDVGDAPEFVVNVGENEILKVLVNDEELAKSDYLVKNGYFAFAYENFQQMGLGVHNVKVVFAEGTKEFTLTVTDVQDAKIAVSIPQTYAIGDTVIPKAERLNDYQAYELAYSLTKGGAEVPMTDNGTGFDVALEEEGDYVYTVSVTKYGTTTKNEYPFKVVDDFKYAEEKEYVSEELKDYFSGEWDETRKAIKANGYISMSNELIHRARYSGQKYLEVVAGGDETTDVWLGFSYTATDDADKACREGSYQANDSKVAFLVDMSEIEKTTGKTHIFMGYNNAPVWLYSARFVSDPLTDNINYSAHAYQQANIWTATDGDGTPWDHLGTGVKRLWTYKTIMLKTSVFKQALELGYTHILFEAENTTNSATLYYNDVITTDTANLKASNTNSSASFANGSVSVHMDIRGLANSNNDYVYIAGVEQGRMDVWNLTFTNKPVSDVKIAYDGVATVKQKVQLGESFDMSKFTLTAGGQVVSDVVWAVNRREIDMSQPLTLSEGTYELRGRINGETGRGSAYCTLSVTRPLASSEIAGELVTEDRMYLWKSGSLNYTADNGYTAPSSLSISNAAVTRAKADGKKYLEVTVTSNSWVGVYFTPGAANEKFGEASLEDGINTHVIDLSAATAEDGFLRVLSSNANIYLKHAEFIDKPVTDKVNYGSYVYCITEDIKTTNGNTRAAVARYDELKQYFELPKYEWKTMSAAQDGTHMIKKSIVEQAVACGYTKLTLNMIPILGATKAYHFNGVSGTAVTDDLTASGVKETAASGRFSVTLDITTVSSISGDWAYLVGASGGMLVLESMFFGA